MTDDERAIRQLIETWMQASRAGDTAAVLSLMTEDAVFMVPGREPFGREAFEATSKAMAGVEIDGTSEIVELQVLGDWAFSRNHIDLRVTPPSSETVRQSGYTLTLYRKAADGRWRLTRDANLLTAAG
ncbi:MAG: YybH family protein [Caulobacteraceae bacterium]